MIIQNIVQSGTYIGEVVRKKLLFLLVFAFCFSLIYYLALILSLIIRFQNVPNFVEFYNWVDNIKTIFVSTPSLKDIIVIAKDEWLLEIGFMNYQFGHGITEWSLFLLPVKMLGVFALGAILGVNYLLVKNQSTQCSILRRRSSIAAVGLGGICVSLASITFSWVVCCSTPTWVVGLAMMGLGVSTSLWLEPLGFAVSMSGFLALIIGTWIAAQSKELKIQFKENIVRTSNGNT